MKLIDIRNLIKEYIGDNRIQDALELLELKISRSSKRYDELLIIKSRFGAGLNEKTSGILSFEERQLLRNTIHSDLLEFVNSIIESDLDENNKENSVSLLEENIKLKTRVKTLEGEIKLMNGRTNGANGILLDVPPESMRGKLLVEEIELILKSIKKELINVEEKESFLYSVFTGLFSSLRDGLEKGGKGTLYLDADLLSSYIEAH